MPSHLVAAGIPLLCIIPSTLVKPLILACNGKVGLPRTAPISQIQSGLWKQVAWVMDLSGWGGRHNDDSWKSDDKPVQRTHFYPIRDSLLIAVWTQSGKLPIIATLTFHHKPTRNSVFTSPNSICLICVFVPPLYFLSIFIHTLLSLSHDRTLTPLLFTFLISLLFFLTPYLHSPFCCCGTLS